ncbi:hypothetical protein [Kitasatospora sp. NPDC097643]|uniref:hypothetical protein n=1 Tax=Kitasatospora sp. NPDC097643 TaxID=3157230 RepID=UPI003328865F
MHRTPDRHRTPNRPAGEPACAGPEFRRFGAVAGHAATGAGSEGPPDGHRRTPAVPTPRAGAAIDTTEERA